MWRRADWTALNAAPGKGRRAQGTLSVPAVFSLGLPAWSLVPGRAENGRFIWKPLGPAISWMDSSCMNGNVSSSCYSGKGTEKSRCLQRQEGHGAVPRHGLWRGPGCLHQALHGQSGARSIMMTSDWSWVDPGSPCTHSLSPPPQNPLLGRVLALSVPWLVTRGHCPGGRGHLGAAIPVLPEPSVNGTFTGPGLLCPEVLVALSY